MEVLNWIRNADIGVEHPENQKVYEEQSQDFAPTIVSDSPLWEGTSLAKDVIQQQLLLQRGKRKALKTKISPLLSLFFLLCMLHKMWVGCLTVAISIIFIHWTFKYIMRSLGSCVTSEPKWRR